VSAGDPSVIDGRSARAQRTRQAIVDALIDLIEEGDVKPAAPRIAQKAGVSLRSIYQHFEDLEALFAAAHARFTERLLNVVVRELSADGTFEERLAAFVDQRAQILEYITPARRAAALQEPFSQELRERRDAVLQVAQAELVRMFRAELEAFAEDDRADVVAAANMVSTWSGWDTLRTAGYDIESAKRIVRRALAALLAGSPGRGPKGDSR
jgi:AcrR family transcriptional regulator